MNNERNGRIWVSASPLREAILFIVARKYQQGFNTGASKGANFPALSLLPGGEGERGAFVLKPDRDTRWRLIGKSAVERKEKVVFWPGLERAVPTAGRGWGRRIAT